MYWMITAVFLVVVNVALQVLDVWTTIAAIQMGLVEQNAVSRAVMDGFGIGSWVAAKAALMVMLAGVLLWLRRADPRAVKSTAPVAGFLALWMAVAVGGNLHVLGVI